jgi:hypothetical protein
MRAYERLFEGNKLPCLGMKDSSLPNRHHRFVFGVEILHLFALLDNCYKSCQQILTLQVQTMLRI